MAIPWLVVFVVVAIVSVLSINFGISPIIALAQNATALIGLIAAGGGIYLILTRKEEKDKTLGAGLVIGGAVIGIGGVFLEIIRTLFSNTIVMIFLLGLLILIYAKKEGVLE